jgi:hypothetical protein
LTKKQAKKRQGNRTPNDRAKEKREISFSSRLFFEKKPTKRQKWIKSATFDTSFFRKGNVLTFIILRERRVLSETTRALSPVVLS